MHAQSVMAGTPSSADTGPQDPFGSPSDTPAESIVDDCRDLLEALATVPDPRKPRGIRHTLVSVLAVAAAAVVAGARSYLAAGQWAAHAPDPVLGALQVRIHPRTELFVAPCESTIRRVLQDCNGDQLDATLGAWLYPRLPAEQVVVDGKTVRVRHEVACSEWITVEEVPLVVA